MVAVYFEAAAVITVLVLLGQVLELRARADLGRDQGAASTSLQRPRAGGSDGSEEEVSLDLVAVGDRLRVRPAKRCRSMAVEDGRSLDESMVTGIHAGHEGQGRHGDRRHAQPDRRARHRARRVGATPCWRASSRWSPRRSARAPIQRMADQVSGWFVPVVIAVAVLAFIVWGIWGPEPRRMG
jgi:Cu+-exporting ATPase